MVNDGRRLPEQFNIVPNFAFGAVVDMAFTSYKAVLRKTGRNQDFLDIWNKHGKYLQFFIDFVEEILLLVYLENPDVELQEFQLLKLFTDYFQALLDEYKERGLVRFNLPQIATPYAINVFQDFCVSKNGSLSNYMKKNLKLEDYFIESEKKNTTIGFEKVKINKTQDENEFSELKF